MVESNSLDHMVDVALDIIQILSFKFLHLKFTLHLCLKISAFKFLPLNYEFKLFFIIYLYYYFMNTIIISNLTKLKIIAFDIPGNPCSESRQELVEQPGQTQEITKKSENIQGVISLKPLIYGLLKMFNQWTNKIYKYDVSMY